MFSLKDMILSEVKKGFEKSGLNPNIDFLGNYLVVTITKNDVANIIINSFPEQFRSVIEVEASEIKIKVRVM